MSDVMKAGSPAWDNRGNYLTPDAAALIEKLRQGRLVRASEPLTIEGHGFGWTGEVREMAHPDAIEAATTIEAQARRISDLRLIVEAIAEADGEDTVGSLSVDIPRDGYPRQWIREAAQRMLRSDVERADVGL